MAKTNKAIVRKTPAAQGGAEKKPGYSGSLNISRAGDLLELDQAIAYLKTTRPTFYRWLREGKIAGMKAGRQWRFKREDLELFMTGQQPRVHLPVSLAPLTEALRKKLGMSAMPQAQQRDPAGAVEMMMLLAQRQRASDLHLSAMRPPGGGEVDGVLQLRVDGVLHEVARFDARLLPALIAQWKTLIACDVRVTKQPQDGRLSVKVDGADLMLMVCILPTYHGESLVARLANKDAIVLDLNRLPFQDAQKQLLRQAMREPSGLMVVNGPAGSGKTTTLYALLREKANAGLSIMTIEDPVEYELPGMVQTQLDPKEGLTYARLLRTFMRCDPDIIMIGEMRTLEEVNMTLQAAMTGHLLLTTMHTNDGAMALRRLVDVGADAYRVASVVRLIVSQRLLRKPCPTCSQEYQPPVQLLEEANRLAMLGGLNMAGLPKRWRKTVGCKDCANTGYSGRTVMLELFEPSEAAQQALRSGAPVDHIRTLARQAGCLSMAADGIRRAANGETTIEEVLRTLPRE